MTNEELLAMAVIRKDEGAIDGLIDLILETRNEIRVAAGEGQVERKFPVQKITVPVERVRVLLFMKDRSTPTTPQQLDRTRMEIGNWIRGKHRNQALILHGVDRVEVYEMPEARVEVVPQSGYTLTTEDIRAVQATRTFPLADPHSAPVVLTLYELRTGMEGNSYERMYAWARDPHEAVGLARTRNPGVGHLTYRVLFRQDRTQFCTLLSDEGWREE